MKSRKIDKILIHTYHDLNDLKSEYNFEINWFTSQTKHLYYVIILYYDVYVNAEMKF